MVLNTKNDFRAFLQVYYTALKESFLSFINRLINFYAVWEYMFIENQKDKNIYFNGCGGGEGIPYSLSQYHSHSHYQ